MPRHTTRPAAVLLLAVQPYLSQRLMPEVHPADPLEKEAVQQRLRTPAYALPTLTNAADPIA